MNATSIHGFTWTPWVEDWKIIKSFNYQIPDNFVGICNLTSFVNRYRKVNSNSYKNQREKINGKYSNLYDFLIDLSTYLEGNYSNKVDPIQYLIFLYYEEWLSIPAVYERVENTWKSSETATEKTKLENFRNFLTNILWWELRGKNERTEIQELKRKANLNTSGIDKQHKVTQEQAIARFNSQLVKILESSSQKSTSFSPDEYDNIKLKKDKLIYILEVVLKRNRDDIIELIHRLHKSGVWARTMSKEFQKKSLQVIEANDLDINFLYQNIDCILVKARKKWALNSHSISVIKWLYPDTTIEEILEICNLFPLKEIENINNFLQNKQKVSKNGRNKKKNELVEKYNDFFTRIEGRNEEGFKLTSLWIKYKTIKALLFFYAWIQIDELAEYLTTLSISEIEEINDSLEKRNGFHYDRINIVRSQLESKNHKLFLWLYKLTPEGKKFYAAIY